jgi:hypothetical protein
MVGMSERSFRHPVFYALTSKEIMSKAKLIEIKACVECPFYSLLYESPDTGKKREICFHTHMGKHIRFVDTDIEIDALCPLPDNED